jgi:hypothetical protein
MKPRRPSLAGCPAWWVRKMEALNHDPRINWQTPSDAKLLKP